MSDSRRTYHYMIYQPNTETYSDWYCWRAYTHVAASEHLVDAIAADADAAEIVELSEHLLVWDSVSEDTAVEAAAAAEEWLQTIKTWLFSDPPVADLLATGIWEEIPVSPT